MDHLAPERIYDHSPDDEPDILGSMEKEINQRTGNSSVTSLRHNTPKQTTKRLKALVMHEDHNTDSTARHLRDFSFNNATSKITPLMLNRDDRKPETKRSDTE